MVSAGVSVPSLDAHDEAQARSLILSQLREAAEKAGRIQTTPIEAVYIVLHAPFATSVMIASETHFERETRIQDATIAQMARGALAEAKRDRTKLMEASVTRIELNGFPTNEPSGKYASHLKIVSLLSECDPELKREVEGELHKLFPAATPLWRSAVRACASFAHRSPLFGDDYFVLDMGADAAQLSSVRSGELDTRTISIGSSTVLAKIAGGRSATEMLGALRMLESGASSGESAESLQKEMARVEPELVKMLAEGIGQMAAVRRVANVLLLLTHRDLEPWLTRLLSRIDFSQFTITTLPFEVRTPRMFDVAGSDEGILTVGLALVNSEISGGQ
jgi:hypothetical protein